MSEVAIHLDDQLKQALIEKLAVIGLSIDEYVNLAARRLLVQGKVPFEIMTEIDVVTDTTRRALVLAEAKELGIVRDDSPEFSTIKALKAYLDQ